ncbi:hypothetical protein [Streptomyces sp. NPDC007100]|uniref:hypothetical protein n=1 Tax=Streptomyces sp. NPDC007100 TaxID=3155602 RepID=UPI00340A6849
MLPMAAVARMLPAISATVVEMATSAALAAARISVLAAAAAPAVRPPEKIASAVPTTRTAAPEHTKLFAPLPVTLSWGDPRPRETSVEAKRRRPRMFHLLVAGRRRIAIDRKSFDTYVRGRPWLERV